MAYKGLIFGILGAACIVTAIVLSNEKEDIRTLRTTLKLALSQSERNDSHLLEVIGKMNVTEIKDTITLIYATKKNKKITDPELRSRLDAISKKYNIFT